MFQDRNSDYIKDQLLQKKDTSPVSVSHADFKDSKSHSRLRINTINEAQNILIIEKKKLAQNRTNKMFQMKPSERYDHQRDESEESKIIGNRTFRSNTPNSKNISNIFSDHHSFKNGWVKNPQDLDKDQINLKLNNVKENSNSGHFLRS